MTIHKIKLAENFMNSSRLVMLNELHYLLLEMLGRKEPVPWNTLMQLCKEKSFNFLMAFENTISFLEAIAVIKINPDGSVSRNVEKNAGILMEEDLGLFILQHTLAYLETQGLFKEIFNAYTIKTDASDTVVIYTNEIGIAFPFIKALLLNFKIAETAKNSNEQLVVLKEYKDFFRNKPIQGEKHGTQNGKTENGGAENGTTEKKHKFFISYAPEDEVHMLRLKTHLSALIRNKTIETWDGRSILPGEDRLKKISQKLEEAEIILFLISPDSMASDYIHEVEMKKAFERHSKDLVKIVPVFLRRCSYKDLPIGNLQVVPEGGMPIMEWPSEDKAYTNVVEQIKKIL